MHYIVYLKTKDDKLNEITICSDDELVKLLQHLDKKRYEVVEVTKLTDKLMSFKEFCIKTPNLEIGEKQ